MGTWGPGLFDNDDATDLREAWKELRAQRIQAEAATQKLAEQFELDPKRADEGADLWLALASLQTQANALQNEVKARALEIIDSPDEAKRWADSGQLARRKKALEALKAKLAGAKKPATRKAPAKAEKLAPGDVVAYQLPDDRFVLFRAFRSAELKKLVTFELLDFIGKELPADPGALRGRILFPEAHAQRVHRGKQVLELIDVFQTVGFARLSVPQTAARIEARLKRIATGLPTEVEYPFHRAACLSGGYAADLDRRVTEAFTPGTKNFHPWSDDAIARAEKLAAQERALGWARCSKCGWSPGPSANFTCSSCGQVAPLFETAARCPRCKKVEPMRCGGFCGDVPTVKARAK